MDFGSINTVEDSNQGAKYHVIDPYTEEPAYVQVDGKDVAVTITVLGPDSDKVRKHQNEMLRASMKKRKGGQLDPEDIDRRLTSQVANAIVSWEGIMMDGQELECNRQNAMDLLNKHSWLREQLANFQQDRANFLKK